MPGVKPQAGHVAGRPGQYQNRSGKDAGRHRPELPSSLGRARHTAHPDNHLRGLFGHPANIGLPAGSAHAPGALARPLLSGTDHKPAVKGDNKGSGSAGKGKELPFGTAAIAPYLKDREENSGAYSAQTLQEFRKEYHFSQRFSDEEVREMMESLHRGAHEVLDIPENVGLATIKDALDFRSSMDMLGHTLSKEDWKDYGSGKGGKVFDRAVRGAFNIPDDVPMNRGGLSAIQFAADMQGVGGDLTSDAWKKWSEGKGDEVIGEAIRAGLDIPALGTEGMSPQDLLGLGSAAEWIGVDSITKGFINDWKSTQNGTMKSEDLIKKWGNLSGNGNSSVTGTGGSGGTGSENTGGNSSMSVNLDTRGHGLGTGSGGTGSGGSNSGSQGSNQSNTPVPPVAGNDNQNNDQNNSQNQDNTPPLTGMNTESDDDNSTRDIDHGGGVVDMDIDGYSGDHNSDIESASHGSSSNGNGPAGNAGTNQQGSTTPQEYVDTAESIMKNNSGDAGYFIVMEGTEDHVDVVDANRHEAVLTAGEGEEVHDDPNTFYVKDSSESGTGVPVASGMNGPDSGKDDGNSSSGNDSDSGSSGSDDNGSSGSSGDDGGSSSGGDDGGSSGSGSDDGGSSSGSDDGGSSSGSDDDSGSGSSSDEGNSSGSDDDSSSDDSARPNPMDDGPSGPVDVTELFQTHAGQTGITNPAGAEGGRNVDTSQIKPPDWRHGQEEVIHTTGEEATGESPITVSGDMHSSPSGDRGGIEMPDAEGGHVDPGSDPLGGRGNPHNNPGAGDPHADDD